MTDTETAVQQIRDVLARMRNDGNRYKSHDLGYIDSVSASTVDEWADEIETALADLLARQQAEIDSLKAEASKAGDEWQAVHDRAKQAELDRDGERMFRRKAEAEIDRLRGERDKFKLAYEHIAERGEEAWNYCQRNSRGRFGRNIWHVVLDDALAAESAESSLSALREALANSDAALVLDQLKAQWFTQGGEAEFGGERIDDVKNADEFVSAVLHNVRSALLASPTPEDR